MAANTFGFIEALIITKTIPNMREMKWRQTHICVESDVLAESFCLHYVWLVLWSVLFASSYSNILFH